MGEAAVTLTAADWIRGHAFTGFPWNAYGYALTSPLFVYPYAQSRDVLAKLARSDAAHPAHGTAAH